MKSTKNIEFLQNNTIKIRHNFYQSCIPILQRKLRRNLSLHNFNLTN